MKPMVSKTAFLISAATIMLGIIPLQAMNEIANDNPAHQEIAETPKKSLFRKTASAPLGQRRTSREQRRPRHGTGSRNKNKGTHVDKFDAEQTDFNALNPHGTEFGDSN